jgi:hypothetical protein
MKFCLGVSRKSVEKIQVSLSLKRIAGALREELSTFVIIGKGKGHPRTGHGRPRGGEDA